VRDPESIVSAVWSHLAGGFIGTMVLTTMVRAANEMGLTRMDIALLLGTTVSDNRRRAKAIGYVFHFVIGMGFALLYGVFFRAVGYGSWWLGAVLGAVQAVFMATVLVNEILPVVHPRIGTSDTAANEVALVEPPGFLMLNYGRNTVLITLAAHIVYGAIVGWTARL
jgi:hypothetical protein